MTTPTICGRSRNPYEFKECVKKKIYKTALLINATVPDVTFTELNNFWETVGKHGGATQGFNEPPLFLELLVSNAFGNQDIKEIVTQSDVIQDVSSGTAAEPKQFQQPDHVVDGASPNSPKRRSLPKASQKDTKEEDVRADTGVKALIKHFETPVDSQHPTHQQSVVTLKKSASCSDIRQTSVQQSGNSLSRSLSCNNINNAPDLTSRQSQHLAKSAEPLVPPEPKHLKKHGQSGGSSGVKALIKHFEESVGSQNPNKIRKATDQPSGATQHSETIQMNANLNDVVMSKEKTAALIEHFEKLSNESDANQRGDESFDVVVSNMESSWLRQYFDEFANESANESFDPVMSNMESSWLRDYFDEFANESANESFDVVVSNVRSAGLRQYFDEFANESANESFDAVESQHPNNNNNIATNQQSDSDDSTSGGGSDSQDSDSEVHNNESFGLGANEIQCNCMEGLNCTEKTPVLDWRTALTVLRKCVGDEMFGKIVELSSIRDKNRFVELKRCLLNWLYEVMEQADKVVDTKKMTLEQFSEVLQSVWQRTKITVTSEKNTDKLKITEEQQQDVKQLFLDWLATPGATRVPLPPQFVASVEGKHVNRLTGLHKKSLNFSDATVETARNPLKKCLSSNKSHGLTGIHEGRKVRFSLPQSNQVVNKHVDSVKKNISNATGQTAHNSNINIANQKNQVRPSYDLGAHNIPAHFNTGGSRSL